MRKFYARLLVMLCLILCSFVGNAQVSVTATAGTAGPTVYTTVKAAFDAINAGTHQGNITVSITANTTETASAQLNANGTGTTVYTTVLIKPASGITPTIAGTVNGPVISIRGSNVTIDGSNNGTTTRDLTVSNADTTSAKLAAIGLLSTATTQITNVVIKNTVVSKGLVGILAAESSLANTGQFANITIQNNKFQGSVIGFYAFTAVAANNGSFNITGNDFSATGTNALYNMAIYIQGASGSTITGNTIGNFDPTEDGDDVGIWLATGTTNTVIEKNKIFNLGHNAGGGYGGHGIRVATATASANITVVNNMVANMYGDGWDYTSANYSLDNPIGILATGSQSGINIYFNTVNLYGNTLDQNGAISAGIYLGAGTTANVKNNIVVNNLGLLAAAGAGATGIYLGASAAQLLTGDFNDYFVNPTGTGNKFIGQIGTAGYATLAGWQTATGKEANSKNVLPVFTSATDLHLVAASNAGLQDLGSPITGITMDIDGETRSTTNPDMGADEFAGSGGDVTPPTISYTTLQFTCTSADRTLDNVTISDVSGVSTTGALVPRIYYKKSTGSTWYSKPGTLTAGTGTNGTWSFTISIADIGTLNAGETVQYYIIAQDLNGTPNIGSNPSGAVAANVNTVTTHPSTTNNYVRGGVLSGNYNVGSGQTYATLTAAVTAYNTGCLNGAVTFTLMDANYANETFPIVILHNPLASATNTLTIKPGAGVNATISGTSTVALIHLKGADYITIDGSNTAGGTTRNLAVTATGTAQIPVLAWITSASTTDGANFNTIKNVSFTGNGVTTLAGILSGNGSTFGNDAEFPNNNNTVSNSSVIKVQNGIFLRGNSTAASYDQNWNITGNTIGSTAAADKLSYRGIYIGNAQGFSISKNTVTGVVTANNVTSTATGINVAAGINGGSVTGNRIFDIKQMNPTGYGANGIQLSSTSTTANVTVANNFIFDVAAQGFAGSGLADNGYGIVVSAGGGYNIYYNTVNMNTNQSLATGLPSAFQVTAGVTTAGAINLRNNIFVNSMTTGTERYAISSAAANTVFASINYNDYYTAGPNLGFIGIGRAALGDIITGFGGNANSKSILPVFISATDLHLNTTSNAALDNLGTAITGITVDYDNDARSATTPDMGADEFTNNSTCNPPAITTQPLPVTTCLQQTATFTVVATGTGITYQWRFNGSPIPGATNATFTISNITAAFAGGYSVVVTGQCGTPVTSNIANLTVSGPCTSIPNVDADITSVVLMPNVVRNTTTLRVNAGRSMTISWNVIDMNGKVVMSFSKPVNAGQNDIQLKLSQLAGGTYQLMGVSAKGRTEVIRLIKL
jgi:trimeric autotransporter adhesin